MRRPNAAEAGGQWLPWAGVLTTSYLALVLPVLLVATGETNEAWDQQTYDAPFIQRLALEWPHLDLINTHGLAMTPGYHVVMAAVRHYTGAELLGLRVATAVLGFPLVFIVFWFCRRWTPPGTAFLLTLPILLSSYLLGSSMWLRSDNVSLFFAALVVGVTALGGARPARLLALGAVTAIATAVRQTNVWTIVPMAASSAVEMLPASPDPRQRVGLAFATVCAVAAPLAVLGYFFWLWGGLVPPRFAETHRVGTGFQMVPVILALTGFFGIFFAAAVVGESSTNPLRDWRIAAAALAALILAAVPRTDGHAGPAGFLLELQQTPLLLGRVVVLLPFAALAGAALMTLFLAAARAGRSRPALFLLLSYASWAAAMTANVYVMRRYCEPFILLLLSWLTALGLPAGAKDRLFRACMFALVGIQCVLSAVKIYIPAFTSP